MTLLDRHYTEKRDYMRMPVNTPATIMLTDTDNQIDCTCRNLSAAGMLLEVNQEFKPGSSFQVLISTDREGYEPFNAIVKVSRCVNFDTDRFLLGVVIDQMN